MNKKLSMDELNRPSAQEALNADKIPVILVLDNVRSFHNVGSVFRSADAFSVEKIILCGITPAPPHREIHKTALGATETVKWDKRDNIISLLEEFKNLGYVILAVEQTEDTTLLTDFKIDASKKYVIVFGNEVNGVNQDAINICNQVIEIPQSGNKHSINVSVCAGIVLWEFYRQLK